VMTLARGPHGRYTLRNLASVRGLSPVMEPGSSPQPRRSFGASLCHACFVAVPGARPERDRSPLRPG